MKRFFLVFLCVILIIPSVFAGDAIPNKICPACGWKLNPEWPIDFAQAKFCGHCGTVLVDAPDENPAPTAAPAIQAKIGDIITFGHYEQDGNLSNGKEEIEWIVLDKKDDQILVISKYGLDNKVYENTDITATWETCSLRYWLNHIFLHNAFTQAEQARIPSTIVSADKNPEYDIDPGNATNDKVFLLSITEANKYFSSNADRKCQITSYAKDQGGAAISIYCQWWLRTPGFGPYRASYVFGDGDMDESGIDKNRGGVIVRPAMWIKLNP